MKVYKLKCNQSTHNIDKLFKDSLSIVNHLKKSFGENNVRYSNIMKTVLVNDIENDTDVYYELIEIDVIE